MDIFRLELLPEPEPPPLYSGVSKGEEASPKPGRRRVVRVYQSAFWAPKNCGGGHALKSVLFLK